MSKAKSILRNLLIFGLIFGAIELASYAVIRTFSVSGVGKLTIDIQMPFNPIRGWENAKNLEIKAKSGHSVISTDADGFSETPLAFENPVVHVAITGGSSAFGVAATTNEFTAPSQLERVLFEEYGIESEVTNLGVRGYDSFQEFLILREYLLTHKPDIVFAFSGYNDVSEAFVDSNVLSVLTNAQVEATARVVRDIERGVPAVFNADRALQHLTYSTDLLVRSARKVSSLLGEPEFQTITDNPRTEEADYITHRAFESLVNYALMETAVERNGGRFELLLQPTGYTWTNVNSSPRREKLKGYMDGNSRAPFQNAYYASLLDQLAARSGPKNWQNAAMIMNGRDGDLYYDLIHYTNDGMAVIAEYMAGIVVDHLQRSSTVP